jgi:hypothetical protein
LGFQPVVASHERALRGLAGPADQFVGEKFGEGRLQFGLRVRLAGSCHEEPGIVRFAGVAASESLAIMHQQVPGALLGEARLAGPANQFSEIGVVPALGGSRGRRDQQECQERCCLSSRESRV